MSAGEVIGEGTVGWPEDVGIIAIEVYFPSQYVDQAELEKYDGVSSGKYTIGLGQSKMGFCTDVEDINSLCLTVVQNLMEHYNIPYTAIGRLEVGTETIIDKSKSIKSVLMQLFEENPNIEGVDTINACFGGTSALFNAVNWVESSSWDGRYALVVAADIAVYAVGNARPTGGAGAVAMLIGAHAPLVMERGLRSIYMKHAYDFYKPDLSSEYPMVDGRLSVECYLEALDHCYQGFISKANRLAHAESGSQSFSLQSADAFLFHSPYCRLVHKSVGRLLLNDFLINPDAEHLKNHPELEQYRNVHLDASYFNKDLEHDFTAASRHVFDQKTRPSLLLANQVGNMYTPSLYGSLVSYLYHCTDVQSLFGQRLVLFSYGSGLASGMFSLRVSGDTKKLEALTSRLQNLRTRLDSRHPVSPQQFTDWLLHREKTHHLAPYKPTGDLEDLVPGTWYLQEVDSKHRRSYKRKAKEISCIEH